MAWLMRGKVKSEKIKSVAQANNDFEFVGLHKARCRQWPTKTPGTKKPYPGLRKNTTFDFNLHSTLAEPLWW
ncbi:MAG: hypothetical protein DRQ44_06600 [Gammaproteobacteria bacterium]|nr:MAG: hypothetical protein DRQ44_06600 [Gammaproteobacteria bacterium]